jgi:hypothetical protein
VADDSLAATPHPGVTTVEVDPSRVVDHGRRTTDVTGLDAVQKHVGFQVAAPAELAGLARGEVHLAGTGSDAGAVVTYGKGLGSILVFESRAQGNGRGVLDGLPLPAVNIDGATGKELATALGTLVTFERDGVAYTVAGLVPPVAAENAARELV